MGDPLQRPEVVLRARRAAADQQHRRALELRIGDGGDAVGDAGPGGRERDPELAGEHGVRMRHVDGGALVAHIDDADAAPAELVPDRLDVPALQPEDAVDPAARRRNSAISAATERGFDGIIGVQIRVARRSQ